MLETGVREDSVLAKCRKEGVLRVGYAQTGPWFYKDAKTGELDGIYKDVVDTSPRRCRSRSSGRKSPSPTRPSRCASGDYDLFGSSLTYLVPRALAVDYRRAATIRRAPCCCATRTTPTSSRLRPTLNKPGRHVLGHVRRQRGAAHSAAVPAKPKLITTTGQVSLGAEPVRAKRADVWISGDSDVILLAKRNESWAHVIEPDKPIDRRPNTWRPLWRSGVEELPRHVRRVPDHQRRDRAAVQVPHGEARRGVTRARRFL